MNVIPTMPVNSLRRATLLVIAVIVILSYPFTVLLVGPRDALAIANVVVLALSAGIVAAYTPVVADALRQPFIDGPDLLTVGIFVGWASITVARAGSLVWRLAGSPPEWLDSSLWGIHIVLSGISAMIHLIAPAATAGRIPTQHWIKIGALVSLGILIVGLLFMFAKLQYIQF